MPRPRKCRRVCGLPKATVYVPQGMTDASQAVILTVDEFETIRLIDNKGLSQEECSAYMEVARTTVQQIYNNARRKLSEALVEGRPFKIEGGEYQLCDGASQHCQHGCWRRRQAVAEAARHEGGTKMIVAIPVDENKTEVCVSFARAPYFLFRDVEAGTEELKENPAAEAEGGAGLQAAQFVVDGGGQALLTVRCGENAAEVLQGAEIAIYQTEGAGVAENLEAFQAGKLNLLTHFHAGFHGIQ